MRPKPNNYFTQKKKKIIQQNLFDALAYSDIFDYPLSANQLFQSSGIQMTRKEFLSVIPAIPHKIVGSTIFYFLPKRETTVAKRLQKEKISKKKMEHVAFFTKILSLLPSISFIGISGSLALMNADSSSDSDIFIITKPHTLWLTRFFVYSLLFLFSIKRTKKKNAHAICANMFFDEYALGFSKEKRNLYIAHEILQLVPLYNQRNQYEKFLISNKWISTYFPNILFPKIQKRKKSFSLWVIFSPFEFVARNMQLWYMKSKKTREITEAYRISFHPIDYETIILEKYKKKLKLLSNKYT